MKLEAPFIAWGRASKLELDVEEPAEPHDLLHLVEIAERRLRLGKHVDGAESRRLARGVDLGIGRELALVALGELPIFPERQLAGDEQERSGAHERDVIRDRRRRFGQNDAHLFQAFGGSAHGGANSSACLPVAHGRSRRRATLAYVAFPVKASLFLPSRALRFGPKRGCAGGSKTGRRAMG